MRVVLDGGTTIQIGATEATPTISIVDYSRRETDDFGVTTVVERGFARRMSVRLIVPFEQVDALQNTLAKLRSKAAQWIADERFGSLSFRGFYKDFQIDVAGPVTSYCTLTIEGLALSEPFTDLGGDPSPSDEPSTLQLLQPVEIGPSALLASNVAEDDYPEWAVGTTYPNGARVILAATHQIYESAAAGNVGNAPDGASGKWIDVGPTNRWAMFDQALGSVTTRAGTVQVQIQAGEINALALLDVTAVSVRVQAGAYDQTRQPSATGTLAFLDIPATSEPVTVTISAAGTVSVGTLLLGKLVALGMTLDDPKAGITDYSKKEPDEFGEVVVVERAWAKRMTVRAALRTSALDLVAGRIAAVRARPSLWIGKNGIDSLTVYGFFKDFSIEVDETISRLALSIEGLSTAGKVKPIGSLVDWPDIADPNGTKPEDNATVGAPPGTQVGDGTADDVIDALKALASTTTAGEIVDGARSLVEQHKNNLLASYSAQILSEERKARWERLTHFDGVEIATRVRQEINERVEQGEAFIQLVTEIEAGATDGINSALAAIEIEQTVRAAADAAETTARELAISLFQADVDGQVADLQAAISSEATTRADADSAETTQRELALSALQGVVDGHVTDIEAAIASEATTRADAISAEAQLREALSASLTSEIADVNAAVLDEATARVASDEAEATARQALAATLEGDFADVSALVTAEQAARVSEDEALASSVELVSASLDGVTASVETIAAVQVTDQAAVALLSTTVEARTASRIELVAIGGDNRAELRLWADANGGAGARLVGDLEIHGDVIIDGTFKPRKIDASLFAREGTSVWNGGMTPAPGQNLTVPFSLTLNPIQPQGRFLYELYIGLTTNANTQQVSAHAGSQLYTNFIDDGGLFLRSYDDQGNVYRPKQGVSEGVRATTVFGTTFVANLSRGNLDTGIVADGDYYYRNVSATYTLTKIDLHVTWIAV